MNLFAWITVPLGYPFMQRALIVSVLVGAACAVLSCYLVLKGWSLMGDAVSHAVLPGIVIAHVVGLPLAVGAFAAGLSCALLTGYLKENSRVKEDTVMGIVFSGMFGLGLVMFTKVETDQHLLHILFGNVLGVTARDLVETALIVAVTLVDRDLETPRSAALLLRSQPRPFDRAAGARAPLRSAHPARADHRRLAQGGRDHSRDRDAGRAGRHRLSHHRQLRAHAGDRDDHRNRIIARSARS